MKIFAMVAILLAGCAETTIYDAHTGKRIARIQGDCTNVTFGSFHADTIRNSTATLAGGKAAANSITALGTGFIGLGGVLFPGTGLAPILTRGAMVAIPSTVAATKQ